MGTQVIGISVDSMEKNKAFARDLNVKFPVLSDETKSVSRDYGVLIPLIRLASRTTFVIDKDGTIQSIQKGGEAIDPDKAQQACSILEHQQK
jgi:peroxiredoxin Q/BCP